MSDMSRPGPPPSAAVHEQHDVLLMAQFAAGDPLDETRQREAQQLVSGCVDCASLVADLRAVPSAVAWEPVPPRRRDFRIGAEQAERLEGNAFTRSLRHLSLPQTRAFQPAAAGILSIGLIIVVAGYAWPDGGTVSVGGEMNAAPAAIEGAPAMSLMPLEVAPPAAGAASDELSAADAEPETAPDAAGRIVEDPTTSRASQKSDAVPNAEGAEESLSEWVDSFGDSLPESQAGAAAADPDVERETAELLEAELSASEPSALESLADDFGQEGLTDANAQKAVDRDALELESTGGTVGESFMADSAPTAALEIEIADAVEPKGIADDAALDVSGVAGDGASESDVQDQVETIALGDDGIAPESLLVAIGFGLALLGALLLLLAWLARRSTDPLLR